MEDSNADWNAASITEGKVSTDAKAWRRKVLQLGTPNPPFSFVSSVFFAFSPIILSRPIEHRKNED